MAAQPFTLKVIDRNGKVSNISVDPSPITQGGTGTIYRSIDGNHIVKIYQQYFIRNPDEVIRILEAGPKPSDSVAKRLAWPTHYFKTNNDSQVAGMVFPNARKDQWMQEAIWYTRLRTREALGADKRGDFRGIVKITKDIASAIKYLHDKGFSYPDLSSRNVLCNPVVGHATLVGIDRILLPGVAGSILGVPGFMAPELIDGLLRSVRVYPNLLSDRHSLATLLFQLLLMRHPLLEGKRPPLDADPQTDDLLKQSTSHAVYVHHPTNHANLPTIPFVPVESLGSELNNLFLRVFVDGIQNPSARPLPVEWENALIRLEHDLVKCTNTQCSWGYFPALNGQAISCPICNTKNQSARRVEAKPTVVSTDQNTSDATNRNQPTARNDQILKAKIFVSYSRTDWEDYVQPLVQYLRSEGFDVWVDQHLLEGGDDWLDGINSALEQSKILILCVSPNALVSKWVKMEYRYFLDENKLLIPVLCRDTKLPPELRRIQCLKIRARDQLVNTLKKAILG